LKYGKKNTPHETTAARGEKRGKAQTSTPHGEQDLAEFNQVKGRNGKAEKGRSKREALSHQGTRRGRGGERGRGGHALKGPGLPHFVLGTRGERAQGEEKGRKRRRKVVPCALSVGKTG